MPCPLAVSPTYLQAYLDEYSLDLVDYRFARPGVANGTVDANQTLYQGVQEQWHQGLSPRVRGNQSLGCRHGWLSRSIPACAGEPVMRLWTEVLSRVYPRVCGGTGNAMWTEVLSRVYPRVCGGTLDSSELTEWVAGLSPRVRGNLHHLFRYRQLLGSIPACAGEPLAKEDDRSVS